MEARHAESRVVVVHDGFGMGGLLLAFLGGAVAGAAAALLTAPQSGAETRAGIGRLALRPKALVGRIPEAVADAADAFTDAMNEPKPHNSPKRD